MIGGELQMINWSAPTFQWPKSKNKKRHSSVGDRFLTQSCDRGYRSILLELIWPYRQKQIRRLLCSGPANRRWTVFHFAQKLHFFLKQIFPLTDTFVWHTQKRTLTCWLAPIPVDLHGSTPDWRMKKHGCCQEGKQQGSIVMSSSMDAEGFRCDTLSVPSIEIFMEAAILIFWRQPFCFAVK